VAVSVSQLVRQEVCEREGVFPDGRDYHHCFFKSEFFDDVDGAWNGEPPQRYVHTCIHSPSTDEMISEGHFWEIFYKERALERYTGKHRGKLEQIIKRKKIRYGL
jgi:hypothetical protein